MSKHRPKLFNYEKVLKEVKEGNFVVNAIRSMSAEEANSLLDYIVSQLNDGRTWLGRKRRHTGGERFEEMHQACDVVLVYNYYKVLMNVPRNTNFTNDPDARPPQLPRGSNPAVGTRPSAEVSFMLVGSGSADRMNSYVNDFRDGIESSANHSDKEWVLTFFSRRTKAAIDSFSINEFVDTPNACETEVEQDFKSFVSWPVVDFFSYNTLKLAQEQKLGTQISQNEARNVWADITISNEDGVKTFIEMKHPGLQFYGDREGFIKPDSDSECNGLHTVIHQGVKYLLVYGVCVCIVSDYNKSYVIELAFDDPEWQNSPRTSIPIRSYAIDLKYSGEDSHLPIQMVLAAIIWHQCHLTEDEIAWNDLSLGWLGVLLCGNTGSVGQEDAGVNGPDSSTVPIAAPITSPSTGDEESMIISYMPAYKEHRGMKQQFGVSEDGINHDVVHFTEYETFSGFDALQMNIESPAIVLCTSQQNLKAHFPSISLHPYELQRKVVLKIFDYCHMEDCLEDEKFRYGGKWSESYDEFISSQHKKVIQEIKCYEKIWEYNKTAKKSKKINAPFLYDYGNLHLKREGGQTHYEGFFVALDYAGEEVTSITDDQIKVAARQLSKMGKLGIKYHDVTPENLRVKDGNLMFIDFNSCELNDTSVRNDGAIIELETVQYELGCR